MTRKLISLFLALALMLSAAVGFAETTTLPDYMTDGYEPIVKEGAERPSLRFAIRIGAEHADKKEEDFWLFQWAEANMGIDIEPEFILSTVINERVSIMFAAGDIPDIIWGRNFSANELYTYGVKEGQLLAVDQYLTPEIMPALSERYGLEQYSSAIAATTMNDGHIYSIPSMANTAVQGIGTNQAYYNMAALCKIFGCDTYMEAVEKEPKTLDEWVDLIYEIKEKDPMGLGENNYPLETNPLLGCFLMTTLGMPTADSTLTKYASHDGHTVVPLATEMAYDYLTLMKQFLADGIIHPDWYTMDNAAKSALASTGAHAMVFAAPYTRNVPDYSQFYHIKPMTSKYSDVAVWRGSHTWEIGIVVFSADTKYPEVACRFVDFFVTPRGYVLQACGPQAGTDDVMDYDNPWSLDDEGKLTYARTLESFGDGYVDYGAVNRSRLFPTPRNGAMQLHLMAPNQTQPQYVAGFTPSATMPLSQEIRDGLDGKIEGYDFDAFMLTAANGDAHYRYSCIAFLYPAQVEPYLEDILKFTEEEMIIKTDYETALREYMQAEAAKFITGVRELNEEEFAKYLSELDAMGLQTVLEIEDKAYQAYLALK